MTGRLGALYPHRRYIPAEQPSIPPGWLRELETPRDAPGSPAVPFVLKSDYNCRATFKSGPERMWGFTLPQVPREMGSKTTSPYVRRDSR